MIKAYLQDWRYKEHWNTRYEALEAKKIAKKLVRHFKVKSFVSFNTYRIGYANYRTGKIELPKKDISLGMICHEVGHLLAYTKGYKGHTKKAYKYIHRIYRYAVKYIPVKILLGLNRPQLLLEKL
jgi:hypothetical protein